MIQQVVLNLISNAIKYTPNGGSVFVSLDMRDDQVVLDVEDTGYGIPKHAMDQIFDPYYRVEEHENKALGTGLGLSIVKRFVKAHGGNIEVVSEVGSGSRFSVQLPMLGGAGVHEVKPVSTTGFRFQDHLPTKGISA
jgi:signal transduction histidine kinase